MYVLPWCILIYMEVYMVDIWLVVALVCTVVVPIAACVGVCLYIVHQDKAYCDTYGSVHEHSDTMLALRDAVEEGEGLWY